MGWESVKLYDPVTLREQADLKVPTSSGLYVAFRPDGKTLVAGGHVRGKKGFGFVKVWECQEQPAEKK